MSEEFAIDLTIDDEVIDVAIRKLQRYENLVRRVSKQSRTAGARGGMGMGAGAGAAGVGGMSAAQQSTMFTQLGAQIGTFMGASAFSKRGAQAIGNNIRPMDNPMDIKSDFYKMNKQQAHASKVQEMRNRRMERNFNKQTAQSSVRSEGLKGARMSATAAARGSMGSGMNFGRSAQVGARSFGSGMLRNLMFASRGGPHAMIAAAVLTVVAGSLIDRTIDSLRPEERPEIEQRNTRELRKLRTTLGARKEFLEDRNISAFTWWGDRQKDGFAGPGWSNRKMIEIQERADNEFKVRSQGIQGENLEGSEMDMKRIEDTIRRLLRR